MGEELIKEKLRLQLEEATMLAAEYLQTYRALYEASLAASKEDKSTILEDLANAHSAWQYQLVRCHELRQQYFDYFGRD